MQPTWITRRDLLRASATAIGAAALGQTVGGQEATTTKPDPTSTSAATGLTPLNPRNRIPLSFIIDDSTCLVNMGHFCMPQFAEAWPEREIYKQPWQQWPREIPDSFVRKFGEWCAENGVKGKYSIVPNPACVGWLDRGLPGWSRPQLEASIALVRDLMVPNWDIHPEMITHTRVIDIRTGRPVEGATAATMENSYPQTDVSVDYLAEYLAYALRILKNCGLPCEGITTPGGFGSRVKDKLPIAVHQAVRDVYQSELPHYFKYVSSGDQSTEPKLEYTSEARSVADLTMNVPAGTGDWFGGWEGSKQSDPDRYCTADATDGRMVELINQGRPAVMLCHWPGMYCNGSESGFRAFQRVVTSIASRFADQTLWMKVSEIGRYWAVKETATLTRPEPESIRIETPLSCNDFTFAVTGPPSQNPVLQQAGNPTPLKQVAAPKLLASNTFCVDSGKTLVCVDLAKGRNSVSI